MIAFKYILLAFLVICAVSVSLTKNLMASVIIYLGSGTVMSVIWCLLRSPDLAITEAAVGVGVTGILFFVTLKKIHLLNADDGSLEDVAAPEDQEGDASHE